MSVQSAGGNGEHVVDDDDDDDDDDDALCGPLSGGASATAHLEARLFPPFC